MTQLDLFPTLCRAAGAAVAPELDGVDLAPLLAGGDVADRPLRFHAPDYGAFRQGAFARKPTSALRQGSLKLVYDHETRRAAVYDLSRDLSETQDLSGARPKRTSALEDALRRWLRENAALQPTPRTARQR